MHSEREGGGRIFLLNSFVFYRRDCNDFFTASLVESAFKRFSTIDTRKAGEERRGSALSLSLFSSLVVPVVCLVLSSFRGVLFSPLSFQLRVASLGLARIFALLIFLLLCLLSLILLSAVSLFFSVARPESFKRTFLLRSFLSYPFVDFFFLIASFLSLFRASAVGISLCLFVSGLSIFLSFSLSLSLLSFPVSLAFLASVFFHERDDSEEERKIQKGIGKKERRRTKKRIVFSLVCCLDHFIGKEERKRRSLSFSSFSFSRNFLPEYFERERKRETEVSFTFRREKEREREGRFVFLLFFFSPTEHIAREKREREKRERERLENLQGARD